MPAKLKPLKPKGCKKCGSVATVSLVSSIGLTLGFFCRPCGKLELHRYERRRSSQD